MHLCTTVTTFLKLDVWVRFCLQYSSAYPSTNLPTYVLTFLLVYISILYNASIIYVKKKKKGPYFGHSTGYSLSRGLLFCKRLVPMSSINSQSMRSKSFIRPSFQFKLSWLGLHRRWTLLYRQKWMQIERERKRNGPKWSFLR